MFKKITLFLVLGLVLLGFNANSQTTRFIVNPASSNLEIGDTLVVAVTSQDFNDVVGFGYSMNWDPSILQFVGGQDDVVPVNIPDDFFFGNTMADIGNLTFTFISDLFQPPPSVADDLVLFEIVRFVAIGEGTSPINLSGSPAAANVVYPGGIEETPLFTNGTVTVGDIAPPPTSDEFECMFTDFGLAIIPDSAATGEQLCLDVHLCNGDNMISFAYSLEFNPAILQYDSIKNFNLPHPDGFFENVNNTEGWVATIWTDSLLNEGSDIPDTLAYEVCFTVIGAGGEMDTVRIGDTPREREALRSDNPGVDVGIEVQDAPIVVSGNSQSAITLVAANIEGSPGDTVCVAVTAQNFEEVTSFQYTFNFDDTNLTYLNHQNFNPNLPNISSAINDSPMFSDTGAILVVYPDPGGLGITLMDGDTLYEVCFIINPGATVGTNVLVGFSDDPIVRGASQMAPTTLLTNNGNVEVLPAETNGEFELTIGTATFCPDSAICIPITVDDGFTNISGGGFRVNFIPADLTYTGIENVNPAFPAGQVVWQQNNPTGTDRIILLMNNGSMDQGGINLAPGEIAFELCFTANGSANLTSPITLSTTSAPEFVDPDFNLIDPTIINDGAAIIATSACPAGEVNITVTETIVNVLCNDDLTGSIALDIVGGDGNFAISWTGSPTDVSGLTTPTISNLGAGSYTVSITSGTQDFTETYVVSEPTPITATTTFTEVTCNGDDDGTITVTPSGGTSPYTYSWSNGPMDQNLTNLGPGTYTLTITDSNMCTFVVPTVTISEPEVLTVSIAETINVSCLDGNDGAISTIVTGGNGGNMFSWSNTGQNTQDINGLDANNYQLTVTDSEGCTAVSPSVTITQPSTMVDMTVDNIVPVTCNGLGSIFITPSGGDNVYSYEWSSPPGRDTQDNEDIPAGGYTVTVTDNSGCSFTSGIIVVETTDAIVINEIISQPNCDSESNGAINLTVTGGTGDNNFTFNWSNTEMTEDLTDLMADDYIVTVTDTDGCTATAMYQLTNSINLTLTEIASTPAGCAGATNGSLTIQVNGGGGNYSYLWDPSGQTGVTIIDVASGTYTVTVTDDDSGCTQEGSFTVDSDAGIEITGNASDASCNGAENGSINITVTGAGNNPTFLWSDNTTQTEDIDNISNGDYVVTVTSTDGQCTQTAAFTVDAGNGFEIEEDGIAQATCDGAENGTVNISVNGASGTPDYLWSNGEVTQDIDNAEGGTTVSVTVTDAAGCVEIASFVIPSGTGFDIDLVSIDNASCGGAEDGAIDIELDGAQLPTTTLEWEGPGMFTADTEDLSGVPSGTYTVFITDAAGCNATATYTIDNDSGISAAVQNATDVTCNGSMDGSITLDILNASDPNELSFTWSSPDASGQSPVGLSAGTYSVTITDNVSGCTDVVTGIEIGNPDPITFTSVVEDITCNGDNDGTLTINAMGGNGGFSYAWSHDEDLTGNVATGLAAGSYIVTITDSQGCEVVTEGIVINEPTAIIVTGEVTMIGTEGSITVTATGGSGNYTGYDWIDPNGVALMGATITGLMPGNYMVTVTDDNGCTGTGTYTVNAADAPNPSLIAVTNVTCFDGNDGSITINVTNGSGNYTFNWEVPLGQPAIDDDVQDPTGLIAGTYNVTVTDDNNVSGILSSIIVGEPLELDYDLMDLLSVSCPGFADGEINISPIGGNGEPYTVAWNIPGVVVDQLNPVDLTAGIYTPTITDAAGCTVEGRNVIVQEPEEIVISLVELTDPSCDNGGDSGTIDIDVEGGTTIQGAGYTYNWELAGSNMDFVSNDEITNLGPGEYFVTVTDTRGCTATDGPYELDGLNAIIIQLDSVNHVRCSGIAEGAIFITATGGSGGLTYEWKNGQGLVINSGSDIEGLIGGNYSVCVTDATGCSETLGPITVNEPQPITVGDIEIENASASADDGEIRLIAVTGGTPDYTFNWEGPNNTMQTTGDTPTISNIAPGEWRVTIVDANGCTEVITDLIIEGNLNIQPIIQNPSCNGELDGSIELVVNGGVPDFNYIWSGPGVVVPAPGQVGLIAGDYSVTVEDANGVVVIDSFTLIDPAPIMVDLVVTNPLGGDCTNVVNSSVIGGEMPYTYTWNTGATTPSLFDVCKGEYSVTIMDANGCLAIPPSAFVTAGPLEFVDGSVNVSGSACNGGAGATLTAEVSGGCGPYTFTLSGANTGAMNSDDGTVTFTGLNNTGMTAITVTDAAGSTAIVDNSTIIEETIITIVVDTTINNTGGMIDCNGAVNITVSGGQLDYDYSWSNGETSQDVSDVCQNESPLSVVVTDANGCIVQSDEFILIEGLSVSLEANNESCAGDADGSIISTVVAGTAPYDYLWSNGEITNNITELAPGSYVLTVTDNLGNTATATTTINGSATAITVTSNVTPPTGGNPDGAIDLSVSGGTPGYSYEWLRDGVVIPPVTPIIAGLTGGTYTVFITDFFGCVYSETFNLAGAEITLAFDSGNDGGCAGDVIDRGTLLVIASGGSSYTYLWEDNDDIANRTSDLIGGLPSGDYTVTVTDASGLTAVGTGTVPPLEEITIDLVADEVNSNITSIVTGGTAPYTYSWNDPDFSNTRDLMDLPSGTYTLVIVDDNGCVNQATVELLAGPCEKVRKVISPNNDGFNDEFIISCANRFEIDLEIYNRWGQLEFMAVNYSNNWVGTDLEGEKLPEGGYFYVIRYNDSEGQTQQIKGSLNIVY